MFEPRRRQLAKQAEARRAWEAKEAHKLELLYNKRVKVLTRLPRVDLRLYVMCSAVQRKLCVIDVGACATRCCWFFSVLSFLLIVAGFQMQLVHRIKLRYHNVCAKRIQSAYRKYRMRKLARVPTPSKIRRASNMAEV